MQSVAVDVQGQFFVPDRKITDDRLLREPIGAKSLHLLSAVIAFVQIHVQRPGTGDAQEECR